ncbi:MAG: hypothetical protein ACI4F3_08040 [Enterocloster sp.]
MTSYLDLPVIPQMLLGICMLFLTTGAIYLFVEVCVKHQGRKYFLLTAGLLSAVLAVFYGIGDASVFLNNHTKTINLIGRAFGTMPAAVIIFSAAGFAAAEVFLYSSLLSRRRDHLGADAVKESLDSLPDGICFYEEAGQPLLVNRQMNSISGELFQSEILNVENFYRRLKEKEVPDGVEVIRTDPTVILRTPDGRVWDFHRSRLMEVAPDIYELTAFDITEQYLLSLELKERNRRLEQVNERLRRFSEEMVTFTAEKELLNAKIGIHDHVGRSLLAFRSYLRQKPEERDRTKLLMLWRYVVSVLKKESEPAEEWDLLKKAADMLHIRIVLHGELPQNLKQRTALLAALRECLTNTARHAGGDELAVLICSDDETVSAELTNSGRPPEGEIQETGGLKNLRRIVEQAGGTMTVESRPRFMLRIEFQKGTKKQWQRQEY